MVERTVQQLGGKAVVPVDPPPLMTIEATFHKLRVIPMW